MDNGDRPENWRELQKVSKAFQKELEEAGYNVVASKCEGCNVEYLHLAKDKFTICDDCEAQE